MQIHAAVLREASSSFEISRLDLGELLPDEVLVRMVATGICHTDLAMFDRPNIPRPIVLGHEGAGMVEVVGRDVRGLQAGDHVVLTFDYCEKCSFCRSGHPAYCREARPLNFGGRRPDGSSALSERGTLVNGHFFGQSSFATHAVVHARNAVRVDDGLPLPVLAPLGCGVQTGAGAVLNVLRPEPGSSIAIFGAGSVGLSAMLAAILCGCAPVIAVDIKASRLEAAKDLGASHVLDATRDDLVEELRRISGGLNYAFSTTGNPASLRQAVDALDFMGTAAFVSGGGDLTLPASTLLWGRSLRGVVQGDSVPQDFIPRLLSLWQERCFPFDRLITQYSFEQINEATQASLSGEAIKPVLFFGNA